MSEQTVQNSSADTAENTAPTEISAGVSGEAMQEAATADTPDKKRRFRVRPSVLIAIGLAIGVSAWILSGPQFSGDVGEQTAAVEANAAGDVAAKASAASQATSDAPRKPTAVRVMESQAKPRQTMLRAAGRTEASRVGRLLAETEGRLIELRVEEGQSVSDGDLIGRIDVDERSATVIGAEALVAQRRIEHEAAAKLANKGFQSEIRRAEALAALEAAKATLRLARIDLDDTRLTAPFDGILMHRSVELGDFLKSGDPVAEIVDLDPIIVAADVSEREVGQVVEGALAQVRLVTGHMAEGVISYISPQADETTRTFKIELEIPNPDLTLKAGVTSEVLLPKQQTNAHLISPALLTLNANGEVGVKLVDAESIARFAPVMIVEDTPEGFWVTGLPEQLTLITVGQEYVLDGQKVTPTLEDEIAARIEALQ